MSDKIIVSNKSALETKYGKTGRQAIEKGLKKLIDADASRGIATSVVFLDDEDVMAKFGGAAVTASASPRQNKAAIDAIFKSANPDYLMILGGADVVPHQDLQNPAYNPGHDDDAIAWGDLPYACDAAYSKDPARFVGPSRVVGRLPDPTGSDDPAYLLDLLKVATGASSRPKKDYLRYFGLSAKIWQGSTIQSLEHIFGNSTDLLTSPSAGPSYTAGELNALAHFINCHGAVADPQFYGQKGQDYPVCLTTAKLAGQIKEGSVAAVECCYGAELYESATLGLPLPICQSYLGQGAYGYLGSTTIAYGPADENGAADFICQDFLLQVLEGASLGRAALLARQSFVERTGQMDPIDLKTLAQFCLLGDPSIHPVTKHSATQVPKTTDEILADRFTRAERRAKMKDKGRFLAKTKPTASKRIPTGRVTDTTRVALAKIAEKAGIEGSESFVAFAVKSTAAMKAGEAKDMNLPTRYFVKVWKPKKTVDGLNLGVGIVAKELKGKIVGYRIYRQR